MHTIWVQFKKVLRGLRKGWNYVFLFMVNPDAVLKEEFDDVEQLRQKQAAQKQR